MKRRIELVHSQNLRRFDEVVVAIHSYQCAPYLALWQANLYANIVVAEDLSSSLEETHEKLSDFWSLSEKMCLGGLLLEGHNNEIWVSLGCLSQSPLLKQHAFIRGLQLDLSQSVAWAYLGKLYWQEGERDLDQQAFDRARSIDTSLVLPGRACQLMFMPGS